MLHFLCKGACAVVFAASFGATAAQADSHTVLIMDGGYFPSVSYVGLGDTIVFTNNTGSSHTLTGPLESWASDPIAVDSTWVLNITNEIAMTYSGDNGQGVVLEGAFSYENPPLEGAGLDTVAQYVPSNLVNH